MTANISDKNLFAAVKKGNVDGITAAVLDGANIKRTNDFGETPLHVAVRYGNTDCAKKLLLLKASLHAKDNVGNLPIHTAATYGKIKCIEVLIQQNKDLVLLINNRRETPVHLAVRNGHAECVNYLLENGASLQAKDSIQDTPLHCAIIYDKFECLQTLLESGASVFVLNRANQTPAETAKEYERSEYITILEKYQFQGLFSEIESLGVESVDEFKNMLSAGSFKCFWNRVYLVGPYNVGKTTLAKNLVGDPVPELRESTDGIWIYLGRAGMDTDERTWIFLPQGTSLNAAVQSMLMTSEKQDDHKAARDETKYTEEIKDSVDGPDNNSVVEVNSKREFAGNLETNPDYNISSEFSQEVTLNVESNQISKMECLQESSMQLDRKKEEKNQKAAMTNEEVMNLVLEACKKGEYRMKIVPIDLWDFGGQKIYYMTHQLFISSRGTFVIIFNGSLDINKDLPDLSYLPGQYGKRTIAVYLMHWVNSILTYCRTSKAGYPKILFVATHKDLVKKGKVEKQRENLAVSIENLFEKHAGKEHLRIRPLIFVNARNENDPEVNDLRKILVETAFSHPRWGEPMPTSFVPLELQLAERVKEGEKIMSRKEIEALNVNNGKMALTESQLKTFLKVQHSLGRYIYFDEGLLKEYVVTDPTYLIEVLRSVVTEEQFWPKEGNLRQIFKCLKEEGMLKRTDLLQLWEQKEFNHILPYQDYMIEMLIRLDIIIEPRSSFSSDANQTQGEERYFLVPCMITHANTIPVAKDEANIYMAYTFIEERIPPAFLYRFLGAFISMWKRKAMFTDGAMATVDVNHELRVYVKENRLVVSLVHSQNKKDIVPTIASTVQESLTRAIVGISQFYWSASDSDVEYVKNESTTKKTVVEFSETAESSIERKQKRIIPYSIDFGVQCSNGLCFFNHTLATEGRDYQWKCPEHKRQHDIRDLKLWFAEKSHQYARKDGNLVCDTSCPGLGNLECERSPSDQQLGRLAASLPLDFVKDLFFQLGLKAEKLEELDRDYPNTADLKFFALWEWKRSSSNATFEQLKEAFIKMKHDHHKLCEVFRDMDIKGVNMDRMSSLPGDELLENLSNNVGKDVIQLGVELEIKGSVLQSIALKHKTKLMEQTRDILREWKKRKQPCYCLAKAFNRIGKLGVFKQCYLYVD